MRTMNQSSKLRASLNLLVEEVEDYLARIKLAKDFAIVERKVRKLEELHGVKRYPEIDNNMNASPKLNEIVLTRTT